MTAHLPSLRKTAAWALLVALVGVGIWLLNGRAVASPLHTFAKAALWMALAVGAGRLFAFLVLDPILRQRRTHTPGFARDLVLAGLYALAAMEILRQVVKVDLGALLGTGALVAAVVGLSLQETLGSLFAGIALHLDPAFRVGDWVEVTGTLRGGEGRESLVGQVMAITWRSVQLRTENGDTDILPNRALSQAVVTNLTLPPGAHRKTIRIVVAPHPQLHEALELLATALGGIPHTPEHRPQVVARGYDRGGVVLELRWWSRSFQEGRLALFEALRLATSVLAREGFPLMGPMGPLPVEPPPPAPSVEALAPLITHLELPAAWAPALASACTLRHLVPGQALLREGDPGQSLYLILAGRLRVVKATLEPEHHVWQELAILGPGEIVGEAGLLTGSPRSATVVAEGEAQVLKVPKRAFQPLLAQHPASVEHLADLMARRQAARRPDLEAPHPHTLLEQVKAWFHLG